MSPLIIALAAAALFVLAGLRIAQEYERGVIFRLGRHVGQRGPGLYWIIPLIERQVIMDLRTRTQTIEQQETITKDSVTITASPSRSTPCFGIASPILRRRC